MRDNKTNRDLCIAMYNQSKLRKIVFNDLILDDLNYSGRNFGIDMEELGKHCINAEKISNQRLTINAIFFLLVILPWVLVKFHILEVSLAYFTNILPQTSYILEGLLIMLILDFKFRSYIFNKIIFPIRNNENINVPIPKKYKDKITNTQVIKQGNAVFYGGYNPFIGSGINLHNWSFVVDMSKGKNDMGSIALPLNYSVSELYKYLQVNFKNLNINNLKIEDVVFINGNEIFNNEDYVKDRKERPFTYVDEAKLKEYIDNGTHSERVYKLFQITENSGEMIISLYLNIRSLGNLLFFEASYWLLAPIKREYRGTESWIYKPSIRQTFRMLQESASKGIIEILASPFLLLNKLVVNNIRKRKFRKRKKEIKFLSNYNYGAYKTVRELLADAQYINHFQKIDKERHIKILERSLFDVIIKFLDSKNVDISDFKENRATIVNNGLFVNGGEVVSENISFNKKNNIFARSNGVKQ